MSLKFYNTLTRTKQEFKPLEQAKVGLYTCGPTVYATPHLGNLRTYIFEDLLKRTLVTNNYQVNHVMNVTDVGHLTSDADEGEDKMEKGAAREHKTVWEVADYYTQIFKQNIKELNILEPDIWCKATDHIPEQIELIKKIEANGFSYKTSDGVYFDTSKLKDYGRLGKLALKGQKAGARVEANPEKLHPTDFALWKFSPAGSKRQMEWPSPWGVGFPGWHIECSAMSMKYLGETFDIHCGGIDHVTVHHPNEIAQSQAATGKPLAKYWLHGEFLVVDEKRMGKSEGNFLTLDWLKQEGISPLAYRYFCLGTHYRKPLNFSLPALESSQKTWQNLRDKIAMITTESSHGSETAEKEFTEAINDDLNMPQALAVMWGLIKGHESEGVKKHSLLKFDQVLGLGLKDIQPLSIPPAVMEMVNKREQARQAKDWAQADEFRSAIKDHGFTVDDTELGPVVKPIR
jgi:cysteinyl-tRNA synthetase